MTAEIIQFPTREGAAPACAVLQFSSEDKRWYRVSKISRGVCIYRARDGLYYQPITEPRTEENMQRWWEDGWSFATFQAARA